jgi:hypothetical protein
MVVYLSIHAYNCTHQLEDDWLPAVITQRREIPVPHTSLVRVLLSVRYDAAGPEEHTAASEVREIG